jgi:hypothetical protein
MNLKLSLKSSTNGKKVLGSNEARPLGHQADDLISDKNVGITPASSTSGAKGHEKEKGLIS